MTNNTTEPRRWRTWRLHVLARSIGYGYLILLPFQIYGWIGVLLTPNVGSLFGTENPLFLVPIGLVLNTPYAILIAAILLLTIYAAELVTRRSRPIAQLLLTVLFLIPILRRVIVTANNPKIGWDQFLAVDLTTLLIAYLAAWETSRARRIQTNEPATNSTPQDIPPPP